MKFNPILFCLPSLALVACGSPEGDDTADMAPDAVSADVSNEGDDVAGAGGAPELVNVQAAIEEECPTVRAVVAEAACEATGIAQPFECSYSFAQDPEGTERTLTLARGEDGPDWDLQSEPDFCSALDRANMMADQGSSTSETTE